MSDEQKLNRIPEPVRKKIAVALQNACTETGSFQVKFITPKLLTPMGINWRLYATPNEKLGEWLDRNYPEFERSEDGSSIFLREIPTHGVVRKRVTNELRGKITVILNEALSDNQSVLLSELGSSLRIAGIDRKAYTGEGLAEWIIGMFPELKRSNDGLRLYREGADSYEPMVAVTGSAYPLAEQTLSMIDLDENIRQMHAAAFMGWWNNNVRTLKRLTGCTGNDPQIWSGIVAQKLSDVFLGNGSCLCGESENGNSWIGFYAGMDTTEGKPIYCVLTQNKLNKSSKHQPLMLEAFSWPGDEENPAVGTWLEKQLGSCVASQTDAAQLNIPQLESQCTRLEELRLPLVEKVRSVLQSLENGEDILPLAADLKAYRQTWYKVRELCTLMEVPAELTSGADILTWCAEQNQFTHCLKRIVQCFVNLNGYLAEILSQNGIAAPDLSVDCEAVQKAYDTCISELHTEALSEMLLPYQQMLGVMDPVAFNQDMMKLVRVTSELDRYFGFSTMSVFGLKLKKPDQYQLFQQDLAKLEGELNTLDALLHPQPVVCQELKAAPAIGEILTALQDGRISVLWGAGGGRNQLEALILEDRLPEALRLACDCDLMAEAGYSEDDRQEIILRLSDEQLLPQGRTVYNAGRRILQVLGDKNETAERYLLMGLVVEREECSTELLRLYRQSNQAEKFVQIWSMFGTAARYDIENYLYYLMQLQSGSPEQIRAYLDEHVFLYYLPECAPVLAAVCPEIELPAWDNGEASPLNELEQALVEDNIRKIPELLGNREALMEMGYSPEQITQISLATLSDSCPAGTDPYQTGMRIYLYQGNLRRLAERYLWQGLAQEQNVAKSERLVCLLAEEQRWTECIRLYNCYASEAGIGADSRQAYLLAMLHADPVRAQQFIRNNLQDFLGLVYQNSDTQAIIDIYRSSGNETLREFYQNAYELIGLLEEDYPRSVILHDRNLRNMVTHMGTLIEAELDDRQIESARMLYQSGNYPQGTDSVSIAKRVYAFLGNYHAIAEKLSWFAVPSERALELLWKIYQDSADTQSQHLLLQNYPTLRQTYPKEYGQYLFDTDQHDLFLDWIQQEEITLTQSLQQAIVRLLLDAQAEIQLPRLEEPVSAEHIVCLTRLVEALVRLERMDDLEALVLPNFEMLLQGCSPAQLQRIMTANETLPREHAVVLQNRAMETQQVPVALYYYNILQIGDLAEQADSYYDQVLQSCTESGIQERMGEMERLAKLYPERYQELSDRIYLLKIYDLLENCQVSKESSGKLAEMLDMCPLDAEEIRKLIGVVQASAHADHALVVQSITKLTDRSDLCVDGMIYLHKVAISVSSTSVLADSLRTNLCQRYLEVLNHGTFPEELGAEAEKLCRRILRSDSKQYQTVMCLYRIERMLGLNRRAEYVLRYLVTQPASALGNQLYAVVEAAAEDCWHGNVPTVLNLFLNALQSESADDVSGYCQFCGILCEISEEDRFCMNTQLQSLGQQRLDDSGKLYEFSECTETVGESLVRMLYTAPDKADYWWACTVLPGLTPETKGKLLYNHGKRNPNMWQECVRHCVEFDLNDMLLQTLREWVGASGTGPRNSRAYLASALEEDPNFFDRWTEPEDTQKLMELLEQLCRDVLRDKTLTNTAGHAALSAIASIAVGLHNDAAIELLEKYLAVLLLHTYSEVGVATALRLLRENRYSLAGHLLDSLGQNGAPITCRLLVDQLNALDLEQLLQWSQASENRLLIDLLLPDGNRPTAQKLQAFTLNMIQKNRVSEGVKTLNMLLEIFPGDYACYDALFILCKCGLENPIPLLHKCLCGLISSTANGSSYYRRNFIWNAKLLAGLNAIIKAKHLESAVQELNNDYQFNQLAGTYCLKQKLETSAADLNEINKIQQNLTSNLENLNVEELDLKCRGILSWVTGDWYDFLYDAWRIKSHDGDISVIRAPLNMGFDDPKSGLDSIGFCRSLMRILEVLEKNERIPFLNWVRLAITGSSGTNTPHPWELRGKLRHVYLAMDLINGDVLSKVGEMPLSIPYEEYSLCSLIYEEKINACVGVNPELLYYRMWMLGAMVDYPSLISHQYTSRAQIAFRNGDDRTAAATYEAMIRLLSRGVHHSVSMLNSQFNSFNALYEAYARISRLMLGDPEIVAKVSDPGFNPWSCMNMTVTLLCTPRGNQAMQMSTRFGGDNVLLSQALIQAVNVNISDLEKLNLLHSLPDSVGKAYLAYVLGLGNVGKNEKFRSYFFKDSNVSWEVKKLSRVLAEQYLKDYFVRNPKNGNYTPRRTLLTTFHQINPVSSEQLPIAGHSVAPAAPVREEAHTSVWEGVLPAFARDLIPLDSTADMETLKEEYGRLPRLKRYYRERLERSERIYRMTLSVAEGPAQILPALINFGLDYYDECMDLNNPGKMSLAGYAAMELVAYVDSVKGDVSSTESPLVADAIKTLETAVENTILYSLLEKGHLSIHSLIDQFTRNRRVFGLMQQMIQNDDLRKEAVKTIYEALDLLVDRYCNNENNSVLLREGLVKAQRMIGSISYGAWLSLRDRLRGLIQAEVNNMDHRPMLSMQILNADQNPEDDYLYGEIRNDGLKPAEDITIQVTYDDSSSDRYRLSSLHPKEHNAFKIRYTAAEGAESLHFVLSWSYVFNGQTHNLPAVEKTIPICQVPEPTFPVGQYETQTITHFYEDENGNIVNPNFYGRKKETAELRNLFRSGHFPSYNNAIVYGIRRAGKSTLLNYVKKYVSLHCDDAIIVKVDCLNKNNARLVQSLFIDAVLNEIEGDYPQYRRHEDWKQLRADWELPMSSSVDRDPEDLKLFYQELKQITGKGLVLMLDEVDNFFSAVEQQTSLDSHLFQILSNMLCHPSSQEAIHFIFCGSKYLLRYRTGDGGLSQLFQRFGSNIIEVGLIPKGEMRKMLLNPYEAYPEVRITEEAIDWIWEYTQGLVWNVKLLANMVMKHVREDGRSIVYPVDVKDRIVDLARKEYCEQFFDGINGKEKDKQERLVVDAMQSLASTRSTYVSRDLLFQILTSEGLPVGYRMTADQVENAIDNLIRLKLLEYSETDKGYRFAVELYRLYFRAQREYPFLFKKVSETEPSFNRV